MDTESGTNHEQVARHQENSLRAQLREFTELISFHMPGAETKRVEELKQAGVTEQTIEHFSLTGQQMLLRRVRAGRSIPNIISKRR